MKWIIRVGCFLLATGGAAQAKQPLQVDNGGSYEVTVSDHEPTRLVVQGDRIIRIFSTNGALEQLADKDSGEVYITPVAPVHDTEIYVKSQDSGTFTLHLHMDNRPGDTLQLIPLQPGILKPKVAETGRSLQVAGHVQRIKELIKRMLLEQDPAGSLKRADYARRWKEAQLKPLQWYQQETLRGEVYLLSNTSNATLNIQEAEFEQLQPRIAAVALEAHELAPQQSTRLFLVREEAP